MSKIDNDARPLTHFELANGYILCRDNSLRLINEAKFLNDNRFYLSTINHCRLANEEIAKSIIIWNASKLLVNEKEKWKTFYKSLVSHKEKLRTLELSIHWDSYKDEKVFFDIITNFMNSREETLYVGFDTNLNAFKSPDEYFENSQWSAMIELEYSIKLHELVFIEDYLTGKSTIQQIVDAFSVEIGEET